MQSYDVILLGGGPANLMAASFLVEKGLNVALYEQNSQIGKKFLIAGKSGLNLSMDYPYNQFLKGYYRDHEFINSILSQFTPQEQRAYFLDYFDLQTYVGSAGKVFPEESAVWFLKSWLSKLKEGGVEIFTHHRWITGKGNLHEILNIKTQEKQNVKATYTVFGFGGNSWRETGSNANWVNTFEELGVKLNPFQPSNSGVKCKLDEYVFKTWNGQFIKNCAVQYKGDTFTGEIRIGEGQLEGSPIYHLNHHIREGLKDGLVTIYIDFKPQWSQEDIERKWKHKHSLSKNVKHLKLPSMFPALYKCLETTEHPSQIIKKYPLQVLGFEELDKAISTIGGVSLKNLNPNLSLKQEKTWYINGEMLDWDAPTGGYLLSACFAMGKYIAEQLD